MFKVTRSLQKRMQRSHESSRSGGTEHRSESSRHHESSRAASAGAHSAASYADGGGALHTMSLDTGGALREQNGAAGGGHLLVHRNGGELITEKDNRGYSETSSVETHEHYERKLRIKKSRGDRDRLRGSIEKKAVREGQYAHVPKDALLRWAQKVTAGYPGVKVSNFTTSWRDGLAFNAIHHRFRPDLIDWRNVSQSDAIERLANAFEVGDREYGIEKSLKPEEVAVSNPEEQGIYKYVAQLHDALPKHVTFDPLDVELDRYNKLAREFLEWVNRTHKSLPDLDADQLDRLKRRDVPPKDRELAKLEEMYSQLEGPFGHKINDDITADELNRRWKRFLDALEERQRQVGYGTGADSTDGYGSLQRGLITDLDRAIRETNLILDRILERIEDAETKLNVVPHEESRITIDGIIYDLNALEPRIEGYFQQVEQLKQARHPDANDYYRQVFGLHQRRIAYLQRCETQLLTELGLAGQRTAQAHALQSSENARSEQERERYRTVRERVFASCEECIRWVKEMLHRMEAMEFVEEVGVLEEMLERHRIDHRDVMDFRHQVDQCIARQAEISAEDSGAYCDRLSVLEDSYDMLRHLSAGRMLDLDTLLAFVRSANQELLWISDRETIEVTRDWSDVNRLDIPMLTNYHKQILHEIELREEQFNHVYNQGSALVNQRHPGAHVIEFYLHSLQGQWEWLVSLTSCLHTHLQDAVNFKQFIEEAKACENWIEKQWDLLNNQYDRIDFSEAEGQQLLKELEQIKTMFDRYQENLLALYDRSKILTPMWQRGERISRAIPVVALCNYTDNNVQVRKGDECTLLDNSDLVSWLVRTPEGTETIVPSVVFRLPPPDEKVLGYLNRLRGYFDKLRKLWSEKYNRIRFGLILALCRMIRGWDARKFQSMSPEEREGWLKRLQDEANKLLADLDPNDPLAARLREELRLANEHFYRLMQELGKAAEAEKDSDAFDKKVHSLLEKLDGSWKDLQRRVKDPIPRDPEHLEKLVHEHKAFEDVLQGLDSDVTQVQELFRQLRDPTPIQRTKLDQLMDRWEKIWEQSKMFVERLKAIELVINGVADCTQIVTEHEVILGSFETLPANMEELRGVHSQLVELQLVLQQQQTVFDQLASDVGRMRQHVARTRYQVPDHPDIDRLEDEVQKVTVRWENVCAQVFQRLKAVENASQIILVYRPAYETEIQWLDRIEATINGMRDTTHTSVEEFQVQLDILAAEYNRLHERTAHIEKVNRDGGKYIREAKTHDLQINQFLDTLEPRLRNQIHFRSPRPTPGAEIVTKELEALNRRFATLSTLLLEKQNVLKVLMQNWRRAKDDDERRRLEDEARARAEADRLRRLREEEERKRRQAEEDAERERRRKEAEDEARRRAAEDAERDRLRRLADDEAKRRAAEDAERDRLRRLAEDEARRRAEEDAERDRLRRLEEEARRRADDAERDRLRRLREQEEEDARRRRAEADRQKLEDDDKHRRWLEEQERIRRWEDIERQKQRPPTPPPPQREFNLDIKTGRQMGYGIPGGETYDFETVGDLPDVAKIEEHEDDKMLYEEWVETRTQFYELEAVKHMQTGEILTFVEALRQGLLDLTAGGEYFDIVSGSKISLKEAVNRGYVSQSLNDCLQTKYGIRDPNSGEEVTLLEAIQRGIYDPETRQLRDPVSGDLFSLVEAVTKKVIAFDNVHKLIKMGVLKLPPVQLEDAVEQGVINVETGTFTGKYSHESIPLKEALRNGYIAISTNVVPMIAITLSEAIESRFINPQSGEFADRNSQEKFTLREAVSRASNLINLNVREIVHTNERRRITVSEALVRNILNTRQGNFTDLLSKQSLTLQDAYDRDLIQRPLTLKDVAKKDLIDSIGRVVDVGTKNRYTVLQAIAEGLLDPDIPHVKDPIEGDIISLTEALERGVFEPSGYFVNEDTQERFSILEANKKGFIVSPVQYTIFDIKGIRNTAQNQLLSFVEAVDAGVINPSSGRVVNLLTKEAYTLPDSAEAGLVDPMLHKLLSTPVNLKGHEVSLFQAVGQGLIDARKGAVIDRGSQALKPKEAYEHGLLSLKSAMFLSAVFNVHPSLIGAQKPSITRRKKRGAGAMGGTPSDNIKMTLAEALKQGLVDVSTQRYRQGGQDMSLQEAISKGIVDTTSEWIVPAKAAGSGPQIEEKTTEKTTETSQVLAPRHTVGKSVQESVTTVKRQRTTETTQTGGQGGVGTYRALASGGRGTLEVPVTGMHVYDAEKQGLLNLKTGVFTIQDANRSLTLEEAVELGIINPNQVQVRDPRTGQTHNLAQAIDSGTLSANGQMTDSRGQKLSFRDATALEFIKVDPFVAPQPNAPKKTIHFGASPRAGPVFSLIPKGTATLEESQEGYSFDAATGDVIDALSGSVLSIDEAIRQGKIPKESVQVKDNLTERNWSLTDAMKWGIIDDRTFLYVDKKNNKQLNLKQAAKLGLINIATPTPGGRYSGDNAIQTAVKTHTRKIVATKEAQIAGPSAFVDYTLQHVIDLGWYNPQTGQFTHPDTRKQMSLKDAIAKGLFNCYETSVIDPASGEAISLLDAVQLGIVEGNTGLVVNNKTGERLNLKQALEKRLIKAGVVAENLDAAIRSGRVNVSDAEVEAPDGGVPLKLHEAISRGLISSESIMVKDPASNDVLRFDEALQRKVVDIHRGLVVNQRNGDAVSFAQALSSGLLQPVPSKVAGLAASRAGQASALSRREAVHATPSGEKLVDIGGGKKAMVKVTRAADGTEMGEYRDPTTGMTFSVKLHGDPYITQAKTTVKSTAQVQAIELEPFAEMVGIDRVKDLRSGRVMNLQDAQRAGLAKVDKKGKLLTKSYAVFRSDIVHALNEGIVDPKSGDHFSLQDAIHSKLFDIRNLTYSNPVTGENVDVVRAANMGLVDITLAEVLPKGVCHPASGEQISTQKAIEIGIVDPRTGRVQNPFNKEELTWLDVLKPVYASLTMEGVYDPRKGYAVPVTSALNEGLIDPTKLTYWNSITEETLPIAEACKKGLIDEDTYKVITKPAVKDWQTKKDISLLDAVRIGIVDPHARTVQLDRGLVIPIARAVQEGKFPADVGSKMRRVDKLTFAEALGQGLIDVPSNTFTDPDSGKRYTIAQAMEQGYIDTGSVESLEGRDEKNLSNVIESDEFDENSGRIREQKTGLYLTFKQAIDRDVIDGDSLIYDTDAGRAITLREAVEQGKINTDGRYVDARTGGLVRLKDAVRAGLIAIIASPMLAGQAVAEAVKRREAEGFKFKLEQVGERGDSTPSRGPTVIEETHTVKFTPRKVEPSLSLRIRTDEASDRIRNMIEDPQSTADRQHEFLENLNSRGFDVDSKSIENPATGQQMSIRDAVDRGLLDVITGEIVNPSSGRRYSVPKAVHLKLVQPGAAEHIMAALNLSLEELHQIVQGLSPARPRSSDWSSPASSLGSVSIHHTPTGDTVRSYTVKDIRWSSKTGDSGGPDSDYKYTEHRY